MDKQTYDKCMELCSLAIRDPKEYCQAMLAIPPEEWRKEYGSFLDAEIREMKYLCKEKEDEIENCRQTIEDEIENCRQTISEVKKEIYKAKEEYKTTRNKLAMFAKLQNALAKRHQMVTPQ